MLKTYFTIAWRILIRNRVYTILNVLGLGLGICTCIVIYLISNYEFGFDAFHHDKEHIYRLGGKVEENNGRVFYTEDIPPAAPDALRDEIRGLEVVAGFYPYRAKIKIDDGNKIQEFDCQVEDANTTGIIITDSNYFSIFKYDWLAGNAETALLEPFKVVLSENRARQYFGSLQYEKFIGKEVIYDDSLRVTVSGIIKSWNGNTDFPYKEFISMRTIPGSFFEEHFYNR